MTKIESKKVHVAASTTEVFTFLNDLNNFEGLLPSERIENWRSDNDSCRFKIKNVSEIGFRKKSADAPNYLQLESDESAPFAFTLNIYIKAIDENKSEAHQVIEANINPFLKMMVEKPLTNLFDYIADRLSATFAK